MFYDTLETRISEHGCPTFLYPKSSLFAKSSLDKEKNMEKGAGIYSLNGGSLNPVSGVLLVVHIPYVFK